MEIKIAIIKQQIFKFAGFICFVVLFIFPPFATWYFGRIRAEWIAILVALEVGVAAIMNMQIDRYFFKPLFNFGINKVTTKTRGGEEQTWYHLCIKNYGFTSAANVRVKIRDNSNKGWVNLTLPYSKSLQEANKDPICINNLSSGEDCQFDLGFIGQDNKFSLALNIYPYNQKTSLQKEESQDYFLEIISDSTDPKCFNMQIRNNGYDEIDIKIS